MFRGRAERDGVQNSNTPGLLHGDFAGQERLWSKIPEVTNADVADVALLSRMEAGARLNAALPPESKEILHSLRTLVAAPVRRSNTLGQPGRQSVTMQASGTLAWCVRKEVRDGSRRFGNWWPVAPGVLCLACQGNSRGEEEERPNAVRYEVGGSGSFSTSLRRLCFSQP